MSRGKGGTMRNRVPARSGLLWIALLATLPGVGLAQAPPEVQNVRFADSVTLNWDTTTGADHYNVYRGRIADLEGGAPRCHGFEVSAATFTSGDDPAAGDAYAYLVTAESIVNGEGTPGVRTAGSVRPLLGSCKTVVRNHVLDRAGSGWNEWTRDRIATLGVAAYIDEQLNPLSINENSNVELLNALFPYKPPLDIFDLIGQRTAGQVYAYRQLEWQMGAFWNNHFNTFWGKTAEIFNGVYPQCVTPGDPPQCDSLFPAVSYEVASQLTSLDVQDYTNLSFNGTFRDLLDRNTRSSAMILYLDTYTSIVGNPNENYARELLELFSMGVDGGYTQTDVEELSRVFTGWTLCKKILADVDDPLAPCITNYWIEPPLGRWAPLLVPANHDCTQKTLFAGTPHEAIIPDTCAVPNDGVNDVGLALDAIVAHPATASFISTKLLQLFITDDPEQPLIDDIVAVWNNAGNPLGVGDLKAVLSAILHHPDFLDPDRIGSKVKTPVEQVVSAIRAVDGHTDGLTWTVNTMINAQHIPHFNEVPTGYSELGGDWIGTNNTLERQNFAIALAFLNDPEFGSDPAALLTANGISPLPGNAAAIIDFFADTMFGGAITPTERQLAIDYLESDNLGLPDPNYDDGRIRQTVAFLLGYAQFQEQ